MEFVLFMLFSMIEAFALYYFMFRLFKVDLHMPSIAFASLLGSYTSYTLRVSAELPNIDIFVQMILLIAFVWLLFQVPLYYSILMACISFVAYVVVQITVYFLLSAIDPSIHLLESSGSMTYVVQFATATIIVMIGSYIHRKRKGFSFVPHSFFVPVKLKSFQIALLILYILTFCSVPISYFLYHYRPIYLITPLFICLLLFLCLYAAYRSDRKHD